MIRSASFSECMKYRYELTRIWDHDKPLVMCIGLNPSKANGVKDDSTINILINALQWLGYGGFKMMNLYALITPHPDELFSVPDALGDNDKWITDTAAICKDIIFCWGAFKNIEYRAKKMIKAFPNALCFGHTAKGSPWHPRALHYAGILSHQTSTIPFKKKK